MHRKFAVIAAVLAALLLNAAVTLRAHAQTEFDRVLAAAKKEGGLVIWGSSPNNPATYNALFEAFNKRFGLNVKGQYVPINPAKARPRIVAESGANAVSVDIVTGDAADGVLVMRRQNLAKPYPYTEVFGAQLPGIDKARLGVPELDGMALTYLDGISGIAWNTTLINDADVPDTWDQLTDKKYAGKVAINSINLAPLNFLAYDVPAATLVDIGKRIMANKPKIENGAPAVARAVTTGSAAIGVTSYHHSMRAIANGEPQKFKFFADYIPLSPLVLWVPEGVKNPNTARLFAASMVTEGIAVANKFEPVPSLRDAQSPLAQTLAKRVAETKAKVVRPNSVAGIDAVVSVSEQLQAMVTSAP